MQMEWLPFLTRAPVVLVLMGIRAAVVGVTRIAPLVSQRPLVQSRCDKNNEVYKWRLDVVYSYEVEGDFDMD
jgi:hypothetical protein